MENSVVDGWSGNSGWTEDGWGNSWEDGGLMRRDVESRDAV